jgi:hypothetical protein
MIGLRPEPDVSRLIDYSVAAKVKEKTRRAGPARNLGREAKWLAG